MTRLTNPAPQHFDSIGNPLSGGKLFFYVVGSSTTLKDTYSDVNLTTVNANPVILDKSGLEPNIYLDGSYRVVLQDKNGVQRWVRDNVNLGSDSPFALWVSTISYGLGGDNIVTGSDGNYYVSLENNNLANDPVSSSTKWELLADDLIGQQTDIASGRIAIGGASGGLTGIDTTPKGTLAVGNGTTTTTLAIGAEGTTPVSRAAEPTGIAWEVAIVAEEFEEFTASGTWTKPAGIVWVYVETIGGGGGGANRTDTNLAGGGGGGAFADGLFRASTLAATVAVTIGAGGAGGADTTNADGATGGTTSFGSHVTAPGGEGGKNAGSVIGLGGFGGAGELPNVNNTLTNSGGGYSSGAGGSGTSAGAVGGDCIKGGAGGGGAAGVNVANGGTSEEGGNGGASIATASTPGVAGTTPGGGGGASTSDGGGGAGAAGRVRVYAW